MPAATFSSSRASFACRITLCSTAKHPFASATPSRRWRPCRNGCWCCPNCSLLGGSGLSLARHGCVVRNSRASSQARWLTRQTTSCPVPVSVVTNLHSARVSTVPRTAPAHTGPCSRLVSTPSDSRQPDSRDRKCRGSKSVWAEGADFCARCGSAASPKRVEVTAESVPLVDREQRDCRTQPSRREEIRPTTESPQLPINRDDGTLVAHGDIEGGIQVNGASGAENAFTVDGVDTTSIINGSSRQNTIFEYIQEVQVKTTGLPAEYGGTLGGVISAVTQSGGQHLQR